MTNGEVQGQGSAVATIEQVQCVPEEVFTCYCLVTMLRWLADGRPKVERRARPVDEEEQQWLRCNDRRVDLRQGSLLESVRANGRDPRWPRVVVWS